MTRKINLCIVGIGNCCKSLISGAVKYSQDKNLTGITYKTIGGYEPDDINFVVGFDVDMRKVGRNLKVAISQEPNCTPLLCNDEDFEKTGIKLGDVYMGPVLDGVSDHLKNFPEDEKFIVSEAKELTKDEISSILKENEVDILVNYLPVGSQKATEFWAEVCLENNISLMNCIPVFIVSNPEWSSRFEEKGIPICGDDMQSQLGASILSSRLQSMFIERGTNVKCSLQSNTGGNTDFANMLNRDRLKSKKISKENVIKNQYLVKGLDPGKTSIHAGPSDYIRYYKDTKVAHIRMEAEGFGSQPITLDCRLSVTDSANSAGVVIDSCRFLKVARERGISGPIYGPCAIYQKTPPRIIAYDEARTLCDEMSK